MGPPLMDQHISLIAGNGEFPLMFIRAAHAQGLRVSAVGFWGETLRQVAHEADAFAWIHVGQLQRLIDTLRSYPSRQVAMAGGIQKLRFFMLPVHVDARAWQVAGRLLSKKDDSVLRAVAHELETEGLSVVSSTAFLSQAMATAGPLSSRSPSAAELRDIHFGFELAQAIGAVDVGQTVVVKDQIPLAIEAIEGTDACLIRGGKLGRGNAVAVKRFKPGQDDRFDLPAIGPVTMKTLRKAGISAMGIEAGRVLMIEQRGLIELANRYDIALLGL